MLALRETLALPWTLSTKERFAAPRRPRAGLGAFPLYLHRTMDERAPFNRAQVASKLPNQAPMVSVLPLNHAREISLFLHPSTGRFQTAIRPWNLDSETRDESPGSTSTPRSRGAGRNLAAPACDDDLDRPVVSPYHVVVAVQQASDDLSERARIDCFGACVETNRGAVSEMESRGQCRKNLGDRFPAGRDARRGRIAFHVDLCAGDRREDARENNHRPTRASISAHDHRRMILVTPIF